MKPVFVFCVCILFLSVSSNSFSNHPFSTKNVTLKSFQATSDANQSKIVWDLAMMEYEVSCYLERSIDGQSFSRIAEYRIKKGFAGSMTALDKNLNAGVYYYRLRMEKPGYIPFVSAVVTTKINAVSTETFDMQISNPFHSQMSIQGQFSGKPLIIEICDFSGRLRLKETVMQAISGKSIRFSTGNLTKGMYILRIKEGANGENLLLTKCIVKQDN